MLPHRREMKRRFFAAAESVHKIPDHGGGDFAKSGAYDHARRQVHHLPRAGNALNSLRMPVSVRLMLGGGSVVCEGIIELNRLC